VRATPGERGRGLLERLWARPTLDVHGLGGGFTGAGSKTVIAAEGVAKVSCRLVPTRSPRPSWRSCAATSSGRARGGHRRGGRRGLGHPVVTPLDHDAVRRTAGRWSGCGVRPWSYARSGGSIPVVVELERILGATPVLLDMGLEDDRLHAPNEKFDVVNYLQGIRASAATLLRARRALTGRVRACASRS
jgi:acetylornithine deacetylase/succinyl-diaminopimelate desuccinylase-like protein